MSVNNIKKRIIEIERNLRKRRRKIDKPQGYSLDWLKSIASEYFSLPSPRFHYEIANALNIYDRIVITAPRGSAKSTVVTLGYPLYCLLFEESIRYILIVSDTFSQAAKLLSSIQHVLEKNGIEHTSSASRVICSGKLVEALGAGCRIRGRRWRQDRPNLIVLDDPQGHLDLVSESARESKWDWFLRDLIPAGSSNCKYVVVGTTIHEGSIVHRIRKDWPSLSYSALTLPLRMDLWRHWWGLKLEDRDTFYESNMELMNEGVTLLWPERWSLPDLMSSYFSLGEDVFRSEYLQEPGIGSCKPLFSDLVNENILVDQVPLHVECFLVSIDPAYSTKNSADWCAITSFFIDWESKTIFIDSLTVKGNWLDWSSRVICERRPRVVVVEINASMGQAANMLSTRLQESWIEGFSYPDIKAHYWTKVDNKHRRIVSGVLRLLGSSEWNVRVTKSSQELYSELRFYPHCKHDDALDSLVLGLRYLWVS